MKTMRLDLLKYNYYFLEEKFRWIRVCMKWNKDAFYSKHIIAIVCVVWLSSCHFAVQFIMLHVYINGDTNRLFAVHSLTAVSAIFKEKLFLVKNFDDFVYFVTDQISIRLACLLHKQIFNSFHNFAKYSTMDQKNQSESNIKVDIFVENVIDPYKFQFSLATNKQSQHKILNGSMVDISPAESVWRMISNYSSLVFFSFFSGFSIVFRLT